MCLNVDCTIHNGEIRFGKVKVFSKFGMKQAKKTWVERTHSKEGLYSGPTFTNLSEPIQNSLIEYLFECGIRPEIGIGIEYLSWNKE